MHLNIKINAYLINAKRNIRIVKQKRVEIFSHIRWLFCSFTLCVCRFFTLFPCFFVYFLSSFTFPSFRKFFHDTLVCVNFSHILVNKWTYSKLNTFKRKIETTKHIKCNKFKKPAIQLGGKKSKFHFKNERTKNKEIYTHCAHEQEERTINLLFT